MQFFILLSSGRSGSTYLKKWLSNHPDIVCMGEKLSNGKRAESLTEFIANRGNHFHQWIFPLIYRFPCLGVLISHLYRRILKAYSDYLSGESHDAPLKIKKGGTFSQYPFRGLKVMYNQLLLFWPISKYLFSGKVIHLLRKNVLAIHVSALAGDKYSLYHTKEGTILPAIRIPLWRLKWDLSCIRFRQHFFKYMLRKRDCLTIYYEDLFSDRKVHKFNEILDFLGARRMNIPLPDLGKTGHPEMKRRISNYAEVARKLRGTRFYDCLDL